MELGSLAFALLMVAQVLAVVAVSALDLESHRSG